MDYVRLHSRSGVEVVVYEGEDARETQRDATAWLSPSRKTLHLLDGAVVRA